MLSNISTDPLEHLYSLTKQKTDPNATVHKVEVGDLPDELKPEKTEDVKLLNKDSE